MFSALLRFSRLALVVALCTTVGLHWVALQTVAWAQMLVSYRQEESFQEAVKKTFDGQHPCDLCKVVQTGKSEQKTPDFVTSVVKIDAVLAVAGNVTLPIPQRWEYATFVCASVLRLEGPATPPPRA